MRKIMACLDIGHSTIKFVVAENSKNNMYVLTSSITENTALDKDNNIVDEELKKLLDKIFKEAEEKLGFKINATIVTVPSDSASFTINRARIEIDNDDGLITSEDMVNVVRKSADNVIQDNMELVNILPMYFTLANGSKTNNPINAISKSLEVKSLITSSIKKDVYKYLNILEDIGVNVVDISYDSIGDYCFLINEENETKTGAIINIGHTKTTVSIFNKGILTNTSLIKVGGINVSKDIAYVYKLNMEDAEKLKLNFAIANERMANGSETVVLKNKNGDITTINQYEISQVVSSRIQEILNMAKKVINTLTKREISYIICTGGIANMKDFDLDVNSIFGKNATVPRMNTIGVRDARYSSSVGLIKWYDNNARIKNRDYSILSLKEQEQISKEGNQTISNNGIIGKVFDYFFDS